MTAPQRLAGRGDVPMLLIADHASNAVPTEVHLRVDPAVMDTHIAVDIGTAALTAALSHRLGAPAIIASVSRLVIDFNREPDAAGLIPVCSDGVDIIGNAGLSQAARVARLRRYHQPYHAAIDAAVAESRAELLISLHSFTPELATRPGEARPWPVGILYNLDDRAARVAIAALLALGLNVGDNQPYSGRDLNATMNRHAEARGLPYLGFEIRQDLIGDVAGIAHWSEIIAGVVERTISTLGLTMNTQNAH